MSFKGRLMHLMMRYRHLLKGKLHREIVDKNTSILKLRKECDEAAERLAKMPEDVSIQIANDFPVYSEWIIPKDSEDKKAVLYFHGGGYVMGSVKSHRSIVANFCKTFGCKALLFDYRLAPEFPAPAAVNDSVEVYRRMLSQGYEPGNIVFAGDSAGGGIEIAALLKLKDDRIPLPGACVAFSPSLDMTRSGDSHKTRAKADPCTPPGMTGTYYDYYAGSEGLTYPYASPLFGELSGLPPIMIHVGNDEVMRDDSVLFGEKAELAGVKITVTIWKGMFHCFPLLSPMFPEAVQAMNQVTEFIKNYATISTSLQSGSRTQLS
jgi:monoterpene epsilon-lactone hydrolase